MAQLQLLPGIIYIDSRVGSRELAPILNRRHGLKTSLVTLDSADVAFSCGHSEPSPFCAGDYACKIGIERKTVSDMIGSLLKQRLGNRQIPRMLGPNGYTLAWILLEGPYRPGNDDAIEVPRNSSWEVIRGPLTYTQLERWMTRYDIASRGKLRRWRTFSMIESAAWIAAQFGWWKKEWKKHGMTGTAGIDDAERAVLFEPNNFQAVIESFPGVGRKKMLKATKTIRSVIEFAMSSPKALQAAGLNKKLSEDLYRFIRKEH